MLNLRQPLLVDSIKSPTILYSVPLFTINNTSISGHPVLKVDTRAFPEGVRMSGLTVC